ncbi:hypothetical protein [Silvimonas amylolytica]|uniref:MetA-pathway of phenol degradation n=1 Tax=Silvimonas amylolytica TaxID=449663 RepID=A0ABQ2PI18_9NEIS|nr:hypothetical protein [Silvimonas amylolytica]GGP24976.1 hypothetical protein GCM10010971_07950 [Silvimonas amylolytica]
MRTLLFSAAIAFFAVNISPAFAAPCQSIVNNKARLACYDELFGRPETAPEDAADLANAAQATQPAATAASTVATAKPTEQNASGAATASGVAMAKPAPAEASAVAVPPHHFWNDFALRDGPGPNATNPAVLAITHGSDNSSSLVQAGLTWRMGKRFLPDTLTDWGWRWYSAIWMNMNTASDNPYNSRGAQLGAAGTLFDAKKDGFALGSSINVNVKEDAQNDTLSQGLAFDTRLILPDLLVVGKPYDSGGPSWFVYPLGGVYVDHLARVEAGQSPGTATGGYAGMTADYYPGGYLWRLKFHASYLTGRDLVTTSGLNRRSSHLTRFGVDYSLAPNKDGSRPMVMPSISLERIVGDNFMDGTAYTAETVLSLKLLTN